MAADFADEAYEERAFLGPNPRHRLIEAYRAVLRRKGRTEDLRASAPPLAVSYVLRGGVARHRMVSPEIVPVDGEYWYDDAIRAGSDHALHWIELERIPARDRQ